MVGEPFHFWTEGLHKVARGEFVSDKGQAEQRDTVTRDGSLYGVTFV
jgi:hypothetical protein